MGRLTKWSIELSEFDIKHVPTIAIKAQEMANFLEELTPKARMDELKEEWSIFVDGSVSRKGGLGVLIICPNQEKIKHFRHLAFPVTNNEVNMKPF